MLLLDKLGGGHAINQAGSQGSMSGLQPSPPTKETSMSTQVEERGRTDGRKESTRQIASSHIWLRPSAVRPSWILEEESVAVSHIPPSPCFLPFFSRVGKKEVRVRDSDPTIPPSGPPARAIIFSSSWGRKISPIRECVSRFHLIFCRYSIQ